MLIVLAGVVGAVIVLYALGSNKIQAKSALMINKDIDSVWEVMGNQFAEVHIWSSNFSDSKPEGTPKLSNVDYLHRATVTERGVTLQELDEFDPQNYRLSYHISKGAPSIAAKAYATWSLYPEESGNTKVVLKFFIETTSFKGRLLSLLIKKKIKSAGDTIAEELKHYLETGKPHPNNQ